MDHPSPSVLAFPPSAASTWALTVPNEPRRFTIPELKIICSFPADFELVGSYGQQWTRLGNAVPPLMMRAIAGSLRDGLFAAIGRRRKGWREAA